MDKEIIETVMTEMVGDLNQYNTLTREYNQVLIENSKNVSEFSKKLDDERLHIQAINTDKIEKIIDQRLRQFDDKLGSFPRKHSFRILFFPEHDPGRYYKLVWGRLMAWLVLIVAILALYRFGTDWLTKAYNESRYRKAWEQLYNEQDKNGKKIMDDAMNQ